MANMKVARRERWSIVGTLVTATVLSTGCASQIAALAPVGGDKVTAVRAAAIDVVTGNGLLVRDTPVCSVVPDGFACVGSLTDGSRIVAAAPPDASTITVRLDDRVLYAGPVQAVLDAAVRGEPLPAGSEGAEVSSG